MSTLIILINQSINQSIDRSMRCISIRTKQQQLITGVTMNPSADLPVTTVTFLALATVTADRVDALGTVLATRLISFTLVDVCYIHREP